LNFCVFRSTQTNLGPEVVHMTTHTFPLLPKIGYPEAYYAQRIREADRARDLYALEAYKVAQYITLALNPQLRWEDKLRYFQHAIRRHCVTSPLSDNEVRSFFGKLAALVQRYAGHEAIRIATRENELFLSCLKLGKPLAQISADAQAFFGKLLPEDGRCPEWFTSDDFQQLQMRRKQWIPK
jgi:hypothetical protein